MSIISKICVLFLMWMAIGIAVTVFFTLRILFKATMLDPDNASNLADEVVEIALNSVPILRGIKTKGKSNKDFNEEINRRTGSTGFERLICGLIEWPSMIAVVIPRFDAAYEQIKDEYDRGLRVRKERLS